MAVRNKIDQLNVDVNEARTFPITINGLSKVLGLYRVNNLVVIYIPSIATTPLTTGELVSNETIPELFLPTHQQVISTMTYITIDTAAAMGCAYIGIDNKLHISAAGYPGVAFQARVPNCGPTLVFTL